MNFGIKFYDFAKGNDYKNSIMIKNKLIYYIKEKKYSLTLKNDEDSLNNYKIIYEDIYNFLKKKLELILKKKLMQILKYSILKKKMLDKEIDFKIIKKNDVEFYLKIFFFRITDKYNIEFIKIKRSL